MTSARAPADTDAATLAWDPAINATLLYGGTSYIPQRQYSSYYNATWELTDSPPIFGLSIQTSANPVDLGAIASYSALIQGGAAPFNYSWSFGDGSTSFATSPSHLYANIGNYSVGLTVRDSRGSTTNTSIRVTVVASPSLLPSATPNPTDEDIPVIFSAGVSGGANGSGAYVQWLFSNPNGTFPPSNGTGASVEHRFNATGVYDAQVWLNDSGGSSENATLHVRVNPGLSAAGLTSNTTAPALGQLVVFEANVTGGTGPYSYSWSFGDGGTGGDLQRITHAYTTDGPFQAQVTVADSVGGVVRMFENLTTSLKLTANENATIGAAPLSVGFDANAVGGEPGYSYVWHFGDGSSSNTSLTSHSFERPGSYVIGISVLDALAHSSTDYLDLAVAPGGGPLGVQLSASDTTISLGQTVFLQANASGGHGMYSLQWNVAGNDCRTVSVEAISCKIVTTGTSNISVSVTDASGASSFGSVEITVGGTGGTTHLPANSSDTRLVSALEAALGLAIAGLAVMVGLTVSRARRAGPEQVDLDVGGKSTSYRTPRRPRPPRKLPPKVIRSTTSCEPVSSLADLSAHIARDGSGSTAAPELSRDRDLTEPESRVILSLLAASPENERKRIYVSGLSQRTYEVARSRVLAEGWVYERYIPDPMAWGVSYLTILAATLTPPDREACRNVLERSQSTVHLWTSDSFLFAVLLGDLSRDPEVDMVLKSHAGPAHAQRLTIDLSQECLPVFFDFEGVWARLIGTPGPRFYPRSVPDSGPKVRESGSPRSSLRTRAEYPSRPRFTRSWWVFAGAPPRFELPPGNASPGD